MPISDPSDKRNLLPHVSPPSPFPLLPRSLTFIYLQQYKNRTSRQKPRNRIKAYKEGRLKYIYIYMEKNLFWLLWEKIDHSRAFGSFSFITIRIARKIVCDVGHETQSVTNSWRYDE